MIQLQVLESCIECGLGIQYKCNPTVVYKWIKPKTARGEGLVLVIVVWRKNVGDTL